MLWVVHIPMEISRKDLLLKTHSYAIFFSTTPNTERGFASVEAPRFQRVSVPLDMVLTTEAPDSLFHCIPDLDFNRE